jgi:hypothetical protein
MLFVGVLCVMPLARSKVVRCPGGRFVVPPGEAPLLQGEGTPNADSIVFAGGGQLVLEDCGPTGVNVHATKKFTTVTSKWKTCGSFQKVRLTGKIAAPACDTFQGSIKAKKVPAKSFTAKLSRCDDGILDTGGGEACDASAPNGDASCPGRCMPAGSADPCTCTPTTTTTVLATSTTITTTTTSSTSTTAPDAMECTGSGLDATVTLVGGGADIGELMVDLGYPVPLDIPGLGNQPSVVARVDELGDGTPGLDSPYDEDKNGDGIDDTLHNDFVFNAAATVPGPFETVHFDCAAGDFVGASQFHCTVPGGKDSGGHALAAGDLPTCTVEIAIPAGGSTTSTTSTTLPQVCGDGTVEAPETCDDGNTTDCNTIDCTGNSVDHCPANCIIASCTAQAMPAVNVSIKITPPQGVALGSLALFLDYPEGQVSLPSVTAPNGVVPNSNDLQYGLIGQALDNTGTGLPASPTALFHIKFDSCKNTSAPAPGDFRCTVHEATDTSFNTLADPSTVACTVTIP